MVNKPTLVDSSNILDVILTIIPINTTPCRSDHEAVTFVVNLNSARNKKTLYSLPIETF